MSPGADVATATPKPATPPGAVARPGMEELHGLEEALERDWTRIQADGHGFAGVRAVLADELGREDRLEHLRRADHAQQAFLDRLDQFLRLLHAHFLDQVVSELDRAEATMNSFYGQRRFWRLTWQYLRLKTLSARYRALEHLHGSAQDHRRIAVYQRFYAGVVAFSNEIRRLDPTMPPPAPPSLVDRLYGVGRGFRWLTTRIGTLARLLLAGLRIVATVLSRRNPVSGAPFTNQVDALFRTLGELQGYEVQVAGRERLEEPTAPSTVRLFTPAHRHGITDNITFAHLALPDYLVFSAVDQLPLLPRFLKERIANTNGLIPVGGGRGPSIDRALEILERGISRNVLIYPEGSVSEGFRGTRPPRPNFGDGLVRRIREAGHPIELVPVTYLDNARFLDLPARSDNPEDRRLRVVVSPSLDTPMVDDLLEAGGGAMLGRVLRLAWLETLVTDERRLLGQDRVREVERRLDLELDGIRYWGSLESAPVSDRLRTRSGDPILVREEPFRGKRVRVFEIPAGARDEKGRIAIENLENPDSQELLIGIRPPSHIYLNVGRRRFDGDIFRRLSVKERDYVYPGILVRFMGVPVKSLHAIRRRLEELGGREQRTLTCANSACRVIARAANIRIDDHADMRPFLPSHVLPTRTIRKLIERGVRNHLGDPVEVQIYKTDPRSLEEILDEARREEIRIARDHARMLTLGAWRATVGWLRRRVALVRTTVAARTRTLRGGRDAGDGPPPA